MDRKAHWEKIYSTKSHTEVSWYAEHVAASLELFRIAGPAGNAAVLDVGGGASTLVGDSIDAGHSDLTVLDLSGAALEIAKVRLEALASTVRWIEEDVLDADFGGRKFDVWHDRAVFHFLTDAADRERYKAQVRAHLKPGGVLLLSVFAEDGPEKCSGLVIKRHGEAELAGFFGGEFETLRSFKAVHRTPSGADQRFLNLALRRRTSTPTP